MESLRIVIIGPGMMPIPPNGWGAIESLVWDYARVLESKGHLVKIVNTSDSQQIIKETNDFSPDFIHIQYDEYCVLENSFECKNIAVTAHYAYLNQPEKRGGYEPVFQEFLRLRIATIFALSSENAGQYVKNGFPAERIVVAPNGVREDLFSFKEESFHKGCSIYLAKVDFRKRQSLFHDIPHLYFAGNIADSAYNGNNYLGEWDKPSLYRDLTKFENLVLLSDGEAHPLVCLEAMSAGLGLVLSEFACANLDTNLPFIDVIPESKINDKEYIEMVITHNRIKSRKLRRLIREYAIQNFSWNKIVDDYLNIVDGIINK